MVKPFALEKVLHFSSCDFALTFDINRSARMINNERHIARMFTANLTHLLAGEMQRIGVSTLFLQKRIQIF